ncbi:MAG: hypothetical protein IIY09_02350, partial [Clostridia bacterium]|nr:hypothetical protein [Clostridia bacterium]
KEPQNHRGLMSQYPGGILKRLDSGTVPAKDRQILEKPTFLSLRKVGNCPAMMRGFPSLQTEGMQEKL